MQDNGSNNIGYHTIDGVKYRDLKPELANAINQVSKVYGGKDLLTYTAIAESTGGWNPSAGTNYMQIMPPAYNAIKDFKSHPKSKQKLQQVKDKFGIDFNTMTLDEVRNNPLANVLASRLYYMLDPNPAPTNVMATGDSDNEGIGDYWTRYYNTKADPDGTGNYFNKAINEFNYKPSAVEEKNVVVEEKVKDEIKDTKKEKSIYDSVGKKGWLGLTDMGITEALFGFKKGGMNPNQNSLYSRMRQLPGGVMQQIPGSDAVEFKGQTHKQGGILMDPQTEVEDGETMDKVVMADGTPKDYFFSSYLKKGGISYADMHKQILAKGGTQEDVNYLAMMQEKSAKRNPKKIAKLGGILQYKKGGKKREKLQEKRIQEELYNIYKEEGGNLSFRKWKKQNPYNAEKALEILEKKYANELGIDDDLVVEPTTTVGLRQDLDAALGYLPSAGDGYTICQSGNCQDGTGVMYTYYAENLEENANPMNPGGTVIGMYEGEFVDGKPTGNGKLTWNDIEQSSIEGVPFVPWGYSSSGIHKTSATGHPELVEGTLDYEGVGVSTGIFKNGDLVSGTTTSPEGDLTKIEDGKETKKFSKNVRTDLVQKGLLEKIPFKYSQGEISSIYEPMLNFKNYEQPTQEELNKYGWSSFDEFRADYERFTDENYNWNNVSKWGPQHQNAWEEVLAGIENKGFIPTGTSNVAPVDEGLDNNLITTPIAGQETIPGVNNITDKITADEEISEQGNIFQRMRQNARMNEVPPLTYLSAATQLAPAIYALTHNQPDPDLVPFESGVTSPIVPGRIRAQKLSHINMDKARSSNEGAYRGMLRSIDQSGSGPSGMVQKMMAYNNMIKNELEISTTETQANQQISNQNVAIGNQTELHNQRMEQEAALGNAQMQQAEAQRLNETNAINTAAKNKIKDDEEYMKYMGVISTAQGFGNLFGDMLAYKGDRMKAQGYDIDGTTQRMLLRQHLGKPLYSPDGTVFSQQATQEDVANYYRTYYPQMNQF
tara:strand:- start:8813 stop:11806 length:2994 start_codon:yes stop_codon:yes gene_type:complete